MLRISRQIWIWVIADSAYNAQNAQFGLVNVHSSHQAVINLFMIAKSAYFYKKDASIVFSYIEQPWE